MAVANYRLILTAVGPVHIGTDRVYKGKDYFLENGKISALDVAKFVPRLNESQLAAYCDFLTKTDSSYGLQDFLEEHGLFDAAARAKTYQTDLSLTRARRGTYQYLDVDQFIKDAYECPYVPGSSVKGMLRTALLTSIVYGKQQEYQALYSESDVLDGNKQKNAGISIEKKAFFVERPDPDDQEVVNDIMRYISVSDSEPLSVDDLVFVRKYDKFAKTDDGSHKHDMGRLSNDHYRKGNELNFYRECLKPDTRISFTLSIDEKIRQYPDIGAISLEDALLKSAAIYKELFLDCFDEITTEDVQGSGGNDGRCIHRTTDGLRCRNHALGESAYCRIHASRAQASSPQSNEELVCYLGGGVGFDNKTIMNALFYADDSRLARIAKLLYSQFPTKIAPEHHQGLDNDVRVAGFSPLKMNAQYRNGRLQKGKEDHRHWRDMELGVSPHTLKLGKIGNEFYPMGKCRIAIEQL